jgi:DNA-binding GntR family transcriptional regulator
MSGSAYEWIKTKILRNEISSRRSLNEKLLAEELKLSRTPVREALIMLEREGHLIREEGRGFFIRQFSMKDIEDMFEYREIVERATVDILISKVVQPDIDDLKAIIGQIETHIAEGRHTDALVKGNEFHMRCMRICGNGLIIDGMQRSYERIALIAWSCQNKEMSLKSLKEHKTILSALEERDPEKMKKAIMDHNKSSKERVINLLTSDGLKWHFVP